MGTIPRYTLIAVLLCLFTATACVAAAPTDIDPSPITPSTRNAPDPPPRSFSVEGRSILCRVYGKGPDTILILGGIHGNEPAGTVLSRQLRFHLVRNPELLEGKRVIVVPALNPDGLVKNQRRNARSVDLNRNFDSLNRRPARGYGSDPLSEPEARYIAELIKRYRPDRIVSIHQPLACVDWDGPGEDLAEAVSEACGLPLKKLGAKPGSLGSYAGDDLRIPIVTLELPDHASRMGPEEIWREYGEALMAAIRFAPYSLEGRLAK